MTPPSETEAAYRQACHDAAFLLSRLKGLPYTESGIESSCSISRLEQLTKMQRAANSLLLNINVLLLAEQIEQPEPEVKP